MGHLSFPLGFQFKLFRAGSQIFCPGWVSAAVLHALRWEARDDRDVQQGSCLVFPSHGDYREPQPYLLILGTEPLGDFSRQTGSSHLCSLPGRICEVTIFSTCVCCSTAFSHPLSILYWKSVDCFSITSVLPALSLLWFYTFVFPIYYHVMRKFFKVSVS